MYRPCRAANVPVPRSLAAVTVLLLASAAFAESDWTCFRGPNQDVSDETGLPAEWDASGKNVLWKTPLEGKGASSPIVVNGRIYLTAYSGYGAGGEDPGDQANLTRSIVCFDPASGKKLGSMEFAAKTPETDYQGFQALHGYASSTPATDGKALYY